MSKQLLIGCGADRSKKVSVNLPPQWTNLVTLDINPDHKPDVVWDLNNTPLPFNDGEFSEIHAYEVLEHIGTQGDYKAFFRHFSELWRLLEPNGVLVGSCPMWNSMWAWGDPSHTRIIGRAQLVFLDQTEYTRQIGTTSMTDFRYIYKGDLSVQWHGEQEGTFIFILQAHKPARIQF